MPIVALNDTEIHYQIHGHGETVVLVHGLGANLAFWHFGLATHLVQNYQVISYDLRGHGRSGMPETGYTLANMMRDLEQLVGVLGLNRFHLVAHSFGANIALKYAIAHADKIISLTLADAQIQCLQPKLRLRDWPHWESWKQKLQAQNRPLPDDNEYIGFNLLTWFNQASSENPSPRRPSIKRREMGTKGAARWDELMQRSSVQQQLAEPDDTTVSQIEQLNLPILAIYGEYSYCLPSCWALKAHTKFCRASVVPRAGHFHPAVRPRRFSMIVQRFMEQYPPVRWNRLFRDNYQRRSIWRSRRFGEGRVV